MTTTTAAHMTTTPPAMITHSVASIRGQQNADISVHHARTPDARIAMTFSGILMVLYSCGAAQGLLHRTAAPVQPMHDLLAQRAVRARDQGSAGVSEEGHGGHGAHVQISKSARLR